MNYVVLSGRLARDPEVKTLQSGMSVCRMTIAVDRLTKKEGQPTADFIGILAWDKTAEFAGKYLAKGRKIIVEGRISTSSYEKDGQKVYRTDIVANRIEFADSKPKDAGETTVDNSFSPSDSDIPF